MTKTDNLILKNKIGGSIIRRRPIYTHDEKYLCILENDCVRSYSTQSGQCTKQYHPYFNDIKCNLVGIAVHNDYLFGVTSNSILFQWSLQTTDLLAVKKLNHEFDKCFEVFNIDIISNDLDCEQSNLSFDFYLSMRNENKSLNNIVIAAFDFKEKSCRKHLVVHGTDDIHKITIGGQYESTFIATIVEHKLFVYTWNTDKKPVQKLTSPKKAPLTVVRSHPIQDILIAGNTRGLVLIIYNVGSSRELLNFVECHWHILPVSDLSFSPSGSVLYSGGSENVLVKWFNNDSKQYLPRLPAPIEHIVVSPQNSQVAVSLQNNSVILVNPQLIIDCTIQQFTWGLIPVQGERLFPAGISCDPNTNCLVLNGSPGHIQFLSLKTNRLLYNVDITQTNYLSQEPGIKIFNFQVTHVAFSQDGKWLATVEMRLDEDTSPEIHLKLWTFSDADQNFKLNTFCDLPHQKRVNAIKFQPLSSLNSDVCDQYCLATTGDDKKFRMWINSVENSNQVIWRCDRIGFYKNQPAGPIGFSSDGSVVAIGFGPCLTIWDVENHELVTSLTRNDELITFVEIEKKNCSHLAVSTTASQLYVWNLLTLAVFWSVPLKVSLLVADPLSDFMALFTTDKMVFVFKPLNPQPVYEKHNICENSEVLGAIFAPQDHSEKTIVGLPTWMHQSQLYFVTSSQELISIELDSKDTEKVKLKQLHLTNENILKTPFAMLKAKQTKFGESYSNGRSQQLIGTIHKNTIKELLLSPVYTMPSINSFCSNFLKSFSNRIGDESVSIRGSKFKPNDVMITAKFRLKKKNAEQDDIINEDHPPVTDINNFGTMGISSNDFKININKKNQSKNITKRSNFNKRVQKVTKKNRRKRLMSKTEFDIDVSPDFGLLNLFEIK